MVGVDIAGQGAFASVRGTQTESKIGSTGEVPQNVPSILEMRGRGVCLVLRKPMSGERDVGSCAEGGVHAGPKDGAIFSYENRVVVVGVVGIRLEVSGWRHRDGIWMAVLHLEAFQN